MNVFVPSVEGLIVRAVLAEAWKAIQWWPVIAFVVVGSLSDCGRMMGSDCCPCPPHVCGKAGK